MAIVKQTGTPNKGPDESAALTGWRRWFRFRPGQRRAIKTRYNRRVRRRPVPLDEPDEGERQG